MRLCQGLQHMGDIQLFIFEAKVVLISIAAYLPVFPNDAESFPCTSQVHPQKQDF